MKLVIAAVILALSGTSFAFGYNYDYSSGYGEDGLTYDGNIDATRGSKYVDGYVTDEYGRESYFEGEFTGYGTIEGYTEDGVYIEFD